MDNVNSNLRIIDNKLFENKFYTTFMKNRKNYQNINYFFSIKYFLKWFTKMSLGHPLTFLILD